MKENLFPFGQNFTILDKLGVPEKDQKPEYKLMLREQFPMAFEEIKKAVVTLGINKGRGTIQMLVGEADRGFGVSKEERDESQGGRLFFWNFRDIFTIQVMNKFENMMNFEKVESIEPRTPKLYLILSPDDPYYYHWQTKNPLTEDSVTEEIKEYIKEFEEGLGIIYDIYKDHNILVKEIKERPQSKAWMQLFNG